MFDQQLMVARRQLNGDLAGGRLRLPGLDHQPVIDPETHAIVGADGEAVASGSREVHIACPAAGEMVGGDGRRRLAGPRPVQKQVGNVFNVQHRPGEPVVGEELAAPGCRVLRAKDLDAVVVGVRHVDRAVGRHCHAVRILELPVASAA
jgi:hypothetical protein